MAKNFINIEQCSKGFQLIDSKYKNLLEKSEEIKIIRNIYRKLALQINLQKSHYNYKKNQVSN